FPAPSEVPVDHVINSPNVVLGSSCLTHLQNLGGSKFLAAVNSEETAKKLMALGSLRLGNVVVPQEQVGHRTVYADSVPTIGCTARALGPYCKILGVSHPAHKDRLTMYTGTRVVRIVTKKAVPNFTYVSGHRVMCECQGMKRVCSRYGQVGHFRAECRTPCFSRCGVFGHSTDGC
ncbi:unnamed protein product, partial [Ixodes pacificus]